jgi:hypothetical protein
VSLGASFLVFPNLVELPLKVIDATIRTRLDCR